MFPFFSWFPMYYPPIIVNTSELDYKRGYLDGLNYAIKKLQESSSDKK